MLSQSRNRARGRFSSSHFERGAAGLGWWVVSNLWYLQPFWGSLPICPVYHEKWVVPPISAATCSWFKCSPPPELMISNNTLLRPLYESSLFTIGGTRIHRKLSICIDGRLWFNCKNLRGCPVNYELLPGTAMISGQFLRSASLQVFMGEISRYFCKDVTPKFNLVICNRNICRNAFQGSSNWWNMTKKSFPLLENKFSVFELFLSRRVTHESHQEAVSSHLGWVSLIQLGERTQNVSCLFEVKKLYFLFTSFYKPEQYRYKHSRIDSVVIIKISTWIMDT